MANRFQIDPADFAGLGSEWGARAHNGRGLLFDDSGYPTVDENLKEPPKVTKQPPRRLPEKPNTGLLGMIWNAIIVNPIKRFFALFSSGSVQKQEFGKLLSSPFVSVGRGYEMPTLREHRGYFNLDTIAEQEGEARVNFLYYLIRNVTGYSRSKVPDPTEIKTFGNYWEQTAVIWPEFFGDHASGLKLLVGSTPLQSFFSNCNDMANNAYVGGVRGVFYESVEIERVDMIPFAREQRLDDTASYAFPEGLANRLRELFNSVSDSPAEWLELENASLGGIKKATGAGNWPLFVPRSLTDQTKEELLAVIAKERELLQSKPISDPMDELITQERLQTLAREEQEIQQGLYKLNQVNNLPEQMEAIAALFAEVVGLFPIRVLIEKGGLMGRKIMQFSLATVDFQNFDPSTAKSIEILPERQLNFPNLSETLGEMIGLMLTANSLLDIQSQIQQAMVAELCSTRRAVITTYDLLDCIGDYLGFPIEWVDEKYDSPFDLVGAYDNNGDPLSLLLGKRIHYKKPIFKVSKKAPTLSTQLIYLLKGATIIEAAFYKRFTKDKDTIGDYLRDIAKASNANYGVRKFDEDAEQQKMTFREWLNVIIEQGGESYTGKTGMVDPWDNPWDERPITIIRDATDALGDHPGSYGTVSQD